jgi:hypothetical protein
VHGVVRRHIQQLVEAQTEEVDLRLARDDGVHTVRMTFVSIPRHHECQMITILVAHDRKELVRFPRQVRGVLLVGEEAEDVVGGNDRVTLQHAHRVDHVIFHHLAVGVGLGHAIGRLEPD